MLPGWGIELLHLRDIRTPLSRNGLLVLSHSFSPLKKMSKEIRKKLVDPSSIRLEIR